VVTPEGAEESVVVEGVAEFATAATRWTFPA
jgi:hypothetical protein